MKCYINQILLLLFALKWLKNLNKLQPKQDSCRWSPILFSAGLRKFLLPLSAQKSTSCQTCHFMWSYYERAIPVHDPNQGLLLLQIYIWAWVDHLESQALLTLLYTPAESHFNGAVHGGGNEKCPFLYTCTPSSCLIHCFCLATHHSKWNLTPCEMKKFRCSRIYIDV